MIASLLQIRRGEGRKAGLLTLLMLFISAGGSISSPGIQAMFFTRFGVEFLPYMYIALGLVTFATSLAITTLRSRISKRRFYQWSPLVLGLAIVGARILVSMDLAWSYPVLWLGMYLMWTLQYLLAWGIAGMVFDTRQAKRLFPLLAAGGILGTALGGLVTRLLVGLVGAENLLLAWAIAFFLSALIIRILKADFQEDLTPVRRTTSSFLDDLQQGYRSVRRSALMQWISAGALLFGLLMFAVLFPFAKAIASEFPGEDAIAGFLGIFNGATTIIAFLTSLLLANRLFARVGFMGALLGFPVIYLLGFVTIAAFPVFAGFVALRFMQVVWRLGVADTAFQAVFNVVPGDRREAVRTFINGVPQQAGVVLAGIFFAFSEQLLQPTHTFLLSAILSAAGIYVIWRARSAYRGALTQALKAGQAHVFFSDEEPFGGFQHDASAISVAIDGIADEDPVLRRISAEILGNLALPEASQALVSALDDEDPLVRAALLRALAKSKVTSALLDVAHYLNDSEADVRLAAAETLRDLAGYPRGLRAQIKILLDDPALEVRSRAAIIILETGPDSTARRVLDKMKNASDPDTRVTVLEALAHWGGPLGFEFALSCLDDTHAPVRRAAAAALARSDHHECLLLLMPMLGDDDRAVRETVANELAGFGEQAVNPAIEALQHPEMEEGALLVLQQLPITEQSLELKEFARHKRDLALEYDDLWRGLKSGSHIDAALELLTDSLQYASRRHGYFAIQTVGILLNSPSAFMALENLESSIQSQRANALEILDSLQEREVVPTLLKVWDEGAEIREAHEAISIYIARALQDDDPWIRACAALISGRLGDKQFRERLKYLFESDKDPLVRETAERSLNGGEMTKTLQTLSIMERILFLKRVPIFADLPPSELKQVAAIAIVNFYNDEEVIAGEGEMGDEMFIIVDGSVRVEAAKEGGVSEELAHRGPGEYVGEMAIISDQPRMASLIADGDVRALCIQQKEFEGIIRERPETGLAVIRELSDRLRKAQGSGNHE